MVGLLPDGLAVSLVHCDMPLRDKGGGVTWEGDFEISTGRFLCERCGLRVEVRATEKAPL